MAIYWLDFDWECIARGGGGGGANPPSIQIYFLCRNLRKILKKIHKAWRTKYLSPEIVTKNFDVGGGGGAITLRLLGW